jgi:DNA-binding transcriptional LysR family regulator
MAELETRELKYFVAVAEELNFTRAAERLGMAQPPLSRAIALLEAKLGVRLFDRTPRQVTLTAAGAVLVTEARHLIDSTAAAWRRTVRAGTGALRLIVAVRPGGDGGMLADILRSYQLDGDWPEPHVVVGGWGDQAAMVRDGRADVALLRAPGEHHGLDTEPTAHRSPGCRVAGQPPVGPAPAAATRRLGRRTRAVLAH